MTFLAPGYVIFTISAAIPLAIHLIGRSRAKPRKFAAIDLLLRGDRRVATRTKIRQLLLLFLRALAAAAVPLILARPFVEARSDMPLAVGGTQSAVIIVDDSLSMSARHDGQPLLTIAKARAHKIVAGLGHDADAALLLGSRAGEAPVAQLTGDRTRLDNAITAVRPSDRATDLSAALKRAAQILETAQHDERRVYLISDLAAHGFGSDVPWAAGRGPALVPIDVTDGETISNHAITDVRTEPAPHLGARGMRISVEIANFAAAPVKDLPVTLLVDGKAVAKGLVDLPGSARVSKRFFHVFESARDEAGKRAEPDTGVHDVAVQLSGDALPGDDVRFARVEVQRDVSVLVVDGDPRTSRRDDEVFYLETALRPGDVSAAQLDVTTIDAGNSLGTTSRETPRPAPLAASTSPDELGGRRLGDFDVIFLCNVKVPDGIALRDYVRHGGGLFIAIGDNVDPDTYNEALGDLLPQPLQAVRSVAATISDRDDGERRAAGSDDVQHLGRFDRNHPALAPLAESHAADSLEAARFARYALFKPTAEGARQVLLRFADGAPALIEGRVGEGRVMVFASTIDRDWNDLPIQPIFLPLMQTISRYLGRAPLRDPEPPLVVGQRHDVPLRDRDLRVEISSPSGRTYLFERDKVAGRRALGFAATDEPGIYKVAVAGADGVLRPRREASFVVNVDAGESDPTKIAPTRLAALAAGGGAHAAEPPKRRVELWHALGAGLLLLLLGEALLLRRK
jgi:hypothetical protein